MAYRFKTRSTTPGEYRLASGTLAQLISTSNIVDSVNRGDGGLGTYPTTAATQAADASAVTGSAGIILDSAHGGHTILGVTGTYNPTANGWTLKSGVIPSAYCIASAGRYNYAQADGGSLASFDLTAYMLNSVVASDYNLKSLSTLNSIVASDYTINTTVAANYTLNTTVTANYWLKSLSTLNSVVASDYTINTTVAANYNLKSLSMLNSVVASDYTANTIVASDYATKASIVSADWVVTGHDNYTGGTGGTYPLAATIYAAGQANQLSTDRGLVAAHADEMLTSIVDLLGTVSGNYLLPTQARIRKMGTPHYGVVGSLIDGLYEGSGAGAVWPAEANVSDIETAWGPTGVEYAGALNMDLYMLIGVYTPSDIDNLLWGPVLAARRLVATSTAFQSLFAECQAPGLSYEEKIAAAALHVFTPGIPPDKDLANSPGPGDEKRIQDLRPFAIVALGPAMRMIRDSSTSFHSGGSISLIVEAPVDPAYAQRTLANMEAAENEYLTLLGDILNDVLTSGSAGGLLAVHGFEILAGPCRTLPTEVSAEGDYYQALCRLAWGVGE